MTATQKRSVYGFFPDLLPEDFIALKASIANHGVEVAIIVDEKGDIIDGQHRQRACDELGVYCPREVRQFESEGEKFELALRLNCRRRQLNRQQKRELIAAYLQRDPQIADNYLAETIGGVSKNTVAEVRGQLETTRQIDKLTKLRGKDGRSRPHRYKKIVANTAKEAETALRIVGSLPESCNGKLVDLTTARRREKRHTTKENRERLIAKATSSVLPENVTIKHCDLRDLDIEPGSVKLILTDVMWDKASKPDWVALSERAAIWLKEDGLLATHFGQSNLVELANAIAEGGLYYQWIFAGLFSHGGNAAEVNGILARWRPVSVFGREQQHNFRKTIDTFSVGAPEKEYSVLQQSVEGTRWVLEHLSDPGDLIVDPCLGTGTTAVAVLTASDGPRTFLGCDRNPEMVRIAKHRVSQLKPEAEPA